VSGGFSSGGRSRVEVTPAVGRRAGVRGGDAEGKLLWRRGPGRCSSPAPRFLGGAVSFFPWGRACARCVWKFPEEFEGERDGWTGGSLDVIGRTQ
jgi:hypothetical protein